MKRRTKKRYRPLRIECMEPRALMTVSGAAFLDVASLTVSLPNDGTIVGEQLNRLHTALNAALPNGAWQEALESAFQTWANAADINFGFVEDNSFPLGVYGPLHGDQRFGDVRIAGVDTQSDTIAEAVSENAHAAGSWAGDILLNTANPLASASDLKGIALHEIGHVLGLEHSADPNSVMFAHQASKLTNLSSGDIAAIQNLHGARKPDGNEIDQDNDTPNRATRIRGSDDDTSSIDGFNGSQAWVHFGGLANAQDVDYYFVPIAPSYTGPLSFEVRTQGISLARLHVSVEDRKGDEILQGEALGDFGGVLRLNVPQTDGEKVYLKISGGDDAFWSTGNYSITIATPERFTEEGASIVAWARQAHRWYSNSEETLSGFSWQLLAAPGDHPTLSDDRGTNDDATKAVRVAPSLVSSDRTVHRVVGSLTDADADFYRFRSPSTVSEQTRLKVTVESLEVNGLIPEVTLFDPKGDAFPMEVRVRGNGQLVVLGTNRLDANTDYTVKVSTNSVPDAFREGNFALTVEWSVPANPPIEFAAATLTETTSVDQRFFYVASPQLFAFSLIGEASTSVEEGVVWATIFDEALRVVAGIAAPLGEVRSAPAILLQPGAYYLQVGTQAFDEAIFQVNYRLFGEVVDRHLGPLLADPDAVPYYDCGDPTTVLFCFPEGAINPVPFDVTDVYVVPDLPPDPPIANPAAPALPAIPLPKPTVAQPTPVDSYFWNNQFFPTNPIDAMDVNGDGQVIALDVLLIINRLNEFGSTRTPQPPNIEAFFDVDGNGQIAPLDALIVINLLNARV